MQFAFTVFSQFSKQLVSNFEPWWSQKYKQLWEPDPIFPYEKLFTVLTYAFLSCKQQQEKQPGWNRGKFKLFAKPSSLWEMYQLYFSVWTNL